MKKPKKISLYTETEYRVNVISYMFMLYVIMLYVLMGHSTFYIYYIIIPKCACVCVCVFVHVLFENG